jgi:exopolysaccharide biosynthesis polyprenyl glycosylphosphotransferase
MTRFGQARRLLLGAMVAGDILLINLAVAVAYWIRYDLQWIRAVAEYNYVSFWDYIPASLGLTALLLIVFQLDGLYRRRRGQSWMAEFPIILRGTLIGIALLIVFFFLYRPYFYSRLLLVYSGALIVVLLTCSRMVWDWIWGRLRRRGVGVDRLLIVGLGQVGRAIMRGVMVRPDLGYEIVGFVDDDPGKATDGIGPFRGLGDIAALSSVIREQRIDEVIVTLPWQYHRTIMNIVDNCERQNVRARIVPDLFQISLNRMDIDDINGIPLLGFRRVSIKGWNLAVKRAIDVIVSSAGLFLLAPVMACISLAIKLGSHGPVLFAQTRVGKGGRPFVALKFRSMREGADQEISQLADRNEATGPIFKIRQDPRVTAVGRFIRRLSLDELPQLYNILRGEMSLIGPRPPIPAEVNQYKEWHRERLAVSPGLTGLWQVSGRSDVTFDEMVLMDIYYIENWSLWLDFRIMFRTIPTVLFADGAY